MRLVVAPVAEQLAVAVARRLVRRDRVALIAEQRPRDGVAQVGHRAVDEEDALRRRRVGEAERRRQRNAILARGAIGGDVDLRSGGRDHVRELVRVGARHADVVNRRDSGSSS